MRYFLIVLAILALLSCSKEPMPTKMVPSPSSTPSHTIGTPTSTVLPRLTRAEAAKAYLVLVQGSKEALAKYNEQAAIYNAGEFYDVPDFLKNMRVASANLLKANKAFTRGLTTTRWPAEAVSSVDILILETNAETLPLLRASKAKTLEQLDRAYSTWPPIEEYEAAANLVRAHLGLSPIT